MPQRPCRSPSVPRPTAIHRSRNRCRCRVSGPRTIGWGRLRSAAYLGWGLKSAEVVHAGIVSVPGVAVLFVQYSTPKTLLFRWKIDSIRADSERAEGPSRGSATKGSTASDPFFFNRKNLGSTPFVPKNDCELDHYTQFDVPRPAPTIYFCFAFCARNRSRLFANACRSL